MRDVKTPTQAELDSIENHLPGEFRAWGRILANSPRLTDEEQDQFLRTLCFGTGEQRRQARKSLIEGNLRLPTWVVRRNQYGLEFADALQEAVIGLIRAIDKFEYGKGPILSTYAIWWIVQVLRRASEKLPIIHLPARTFQLVCKASYLIQALSISYEKPLTDKERIEAVSKGLKVTKDEAARLLYVYPNQPLSLDLPVAEDADDTFGDLIPDESESVPSAADRRETIGEIKQAALDLPPQQKQVIELRYGLSGQMPLTLEATGKVMRLTREWVRQIELAAIKNLKLILVPHPR